MNGRYRSGAAALAAAVVFIAAGHACASAQEGHVAINKIDLLRAVPLVFFDAQAAPGSYSCGCSLGIANVLCGDPGPVIESVIVGQGATALDLRLLLHETEPSQPVAEGDAGTFNSGQSGEGRFHPSGIVVRGRRAWVACGFWQRGQRQARRSLTRRPRGQGESPTRNTRCDALQADPQALLMTRAGEPALPAVA